MKIESQLISASDAAALSKTIARMERGGWITVPESLSTSMAGTQHNIYHSFAIVMQRDFVEPVISPTTPHEAGCPCYSCGTYQNQ